MRSNFLHCHLLALGGGASLVTVARPAAAQDGPSAGVIRITDTTPAPPELSAPPQAGQSQHQAAAGPQGCQSGKCGTCQNGPNCRGECGSRSCLDRLFSGRGKGDCDADYDPGDFDGIDSDGDGYDRDRTAGRYPGYGERYTPEQWQQNLQRFKHRYGYFVPHGQVPASGHYGMAYAVNPDYWDKRDSGPLYGAEGYGIPMAVPLAPVVNRTYNYGWGIPSSRLTPISRLVPQQQLPPIR